MDIHMQIHTYTHYLNTDTQAQICTQTHAAHFHNTSHMLTYTHIHLHPILTHPQARAAHEQEEAPESTPKACVSEGRSLRREGKEPCSAHQPHWNSNLVPGPVSAEEPGRKSASVPTPERKEAKP